MDLAVRSPKTRRKIAAKKTGAAGGRVAREKSVAELLKGFIGSGADSGAPADASTNYKHYLRAALVKKHSR